jgi:hypothetical protein
MKNILSSLVAVLMLAGSAYAQSADAGGTWDVTFTTPNGPMAVSLTLKKDGEKLTGSIVGPQGEVAVQGTQKDKAVAVNFSVQTPNGPFAIVMNGNQDGDAISGTMDFNGQGQAEWSGKRRGGAPATAPAAAPAQTDKPPAQEDKPPAQADTPIDVTGAWAFQIEIGGGTTGTPTVTFKQEGEKLSGTYSSQVLGEQQLTGTIKGNAITFGFQASFDGNAVKVTYSGTVEKDSMKGTVTFGDLGEGTFTAKKK